MIIPITDTDAKHNSSTPYSSTPQQKKILADKNTISSSIVNATKDLPINGEKLEILIPKANPTQFIPIQRVENEFPKIPRNFKLKNWNKTAHDFDEVAFDPDYRGSHGPVFWWDDTKKIFAEKTFGIDTYLGDPRMGPPDKLSASEGITGISAVIGATYVGIDKSNQKGNNFVKMLSCFHLPKEKILSDSRHGSGGSFWYMIYPNVLYWYLADLYPHVEGVDLIMKTSADQWKNANETIDGRYWSTYFDFLKMNVADHMTNWVEPDSAAGIAFLMTIAHAKYGEEGYLTEAKRAFAFMEDEKSNIFYEILMPFAVYSAARLNAEEGMNLNVSKYANWTISGTTACRVSFGVEARSYGDYDFHGLIGDVRGGYVFAMNTFAYAMPLIPTVRYEPGLAKSIGRWMLNAVNNTKYFYPDELPAENQSDAGLIGEYKNVFGYEGIRKSHNGTEPYAMGDPKMLGWAPSDLSLYGSTHVGVFGGIYKQTNVPEILKIDCLMTDIFRKKAFPTYLYYNPHDKEKEVEIDLGENPQHLYDLVSKKILLNNLKGKQTIIIPPDQSVVVSLLPVNPHYHIQGRQLKYQDIIIDYQFK